ncbi:ubiquitin carboxyl-terminal hydrolase 23 isoform X2 [Brachypodium distachyon]|uniref:ubiquitin carboxyl-terminal hydrolase 23 isoform X2 n=1 Tax=Brachypodium distachyon TaxID=15368 RepID=UPI00052FE147|nr:ubiquitin carboxyl-terminal hydrolase 23 isoform X2 [Brachypodium distachyon]|eukprot:XP_024318308.1 ubiquitin carboxyl-terminal hydrolase 23 isoform X2 [Brachypodium distachyon]
MGEATAPEGLAHRRIEFHAAIRPHATALQAVRGFRPERLCPDPDERASAAAAARSEKWETGEPSGFGRELTAARIYLRRIGAGLQNLGNTCYLNSVLQCLTYTEPFVAYLQSGKHKSSCRTAGFCALCALQNHVRCALQSTGKILTPMQFVKNLRCISRSFRNYRQEDAHELMVNLLESMHKCCLPSGMPSQSPSAYEKSLVHRIFGGRLRSQVKCVSCSHCSSKFDPFLDLSLEIANAATLVKALQNFTEEELLDDGEKQYNCQHCRQKVAAKKRFTIDKAPDVLTIHLKRFSPFNPRHKIDKKVDFQPTLDLKPFVSNSEDMDFRYNLYGVLVHAGWNTQAGHYYCFVRTSSGMWHNLDDNQVHQVREADVLRQKAYMLFYVRDRVRSSVIFKDNGAANYYKKNPIPEKITCMNGTNRNSLMETTLNVSPFINGDVKSQKQNSDNDHSSIFGSSSRGQCSKNPSNIEVIEAATIQNNDMVSVQQAPSLHPVGAATLSIQTNKTTSDSQTETMSPAQPDAIVLHDSSFDQKEHEKLLEEKQLESNGAVSESGKDITAALPICNGGDGLLGENCQASESQNPYGEPILGTSKAVASPQMVETKDTGLSNETLSIREDLICCNETKESAESAKQHGQVVTAKELSVEKTAPIESTVEQTPVQSSKSEVGQAMMKELYLKYTDHIANAEEPVNSEKQMCFEDSVQLICSEVSAQPICSEVSAQPICSEVSAQPICSEVSAQPICSEVSAQLICSEVSAQAICSEVSAQVICSGDSAPVLDKDPGLGNLHGMMDFKSKKHVKFSVAPLLFGSKRMLLVALKLPKKRKYKRSKRRSTFFMDHQSIADDQQTSTSETGLAKDISCKSHRRKHSRASASLDTGDQMLNKNQHLAGDSSSAADLPMGRKDYKDAALASAELPHSCPSLVADPTDSINCADANKRIPRHFDLLTRGLSEITVPRWVDIDMPYTKTTEFQHMRTNSIGYVLDQWDEEYDHGRRKKVRRKSKDEYGGPNHFQEITDMRSRQGKRLKSGQTRPGNQPLRI